MLQYKSWRIFRWSPVILIKSGEPRINSNSPKEVSSYLFKDSGLGARFLINTVRARFNFALISSLAEIFTKKSISFGSDEIKLVVIKHHSISASILRFRGSWSKFGKWISFPHLMTKNGPELWKMFEKYEIYCFFMCFSTMWVPSKHETLGATIQFDNSFQGKNGPVSKPYQISLSFPACKQKKLVSIETCPRLQYFSLPHIFYIIYEIKRNWNWNWNSLLWLSISSRFHVCFVCHHAGDCTYMREIVFIA